METKAKIGDLIKVILDKREEEGTLMPSTRKNCIIIKLDNGYNLGFEKKDIKKIILLEEKKKIRKISRHVQDNSELPTISILHTGGTIASKVDYSSGGVVASFTADDFLEMFPEIESMANVRTKLVANMMSEDIRFSHYKQIANAIVNEIKAGTQGIIVGHGTDTLAITAAALAFMFEELPVPVIFVGSQRSTDRGSSDAGMNLICATKFITSTDFKGVGICLHGSIDDDNCLILPATKTRKMHTSRRDAFKAVNDTAIAEIKFPSLDVEFIKKDYSEKDKDKEKIDNKNQNNKSEINTNNNCVILKEKLEGKVGLIRTHPNMFKDVFEVFRKHNYKGLILEGSGIGQAPTNIAEHVPIYEELKRFIEEGGVVVLTSQCIYGRVHKEIYTNCRRLAEIGVIFGEDMLSETAFVKLAWLLGNYSVEDTRKLIVKNLRGEINERIEPEKNCEEK